MNQDDIKKGIASLEGQGASQGDIQAWLDTLKGSGAPAQGQNQVNPGGFMHDMFAETLKTPARLVENLAGVGKDIKGIYQTVTGDSAGAQNTMDELHKMDTRGVDTGTYKGLRPIGTSGNFGQDVAGAAGAGLELSSYLMAPLKTGAGFWNTIKEAIPLAATFGAGKGLQASGDGADPLSAAGTGIANAVGAAAGYGLFKGGAQLFSNWGARALQSQAVATAGSWMKDFAEKTFTAMPEAFNKEALAPIYGMAAPKPGETAPLGDMVAATTRRTYAALKDEFDKNYSTAKDAVVDSLMPEVNKPDLTLAKYQRSLSETMGNNFRKANTLYDDVKADHTKIDQFTIAGSALDKAPKIPTMPTPASSAAERQAYMDAVQSGSQTFQTFMGTMQSATKQPLTLKQVMGLWQESMSALTGATNDERVVIRDFASGLYADARQVLEKKNPELLDQWDGAYQQWKKSVDLYESGPLNSLKSVGDVDTFVDTMLSKQMTRPEQETFVQSLGDNKPAVQDLFINSVLRKAKQLDPNEGSKFIQKFLDGYSDNLLSPAQTKMLDDLSHFMGGDFDQFVLGMRQAQGLTDQAAGDLLKGQTQQDLLKTVNDGRLDQIAERFTKMADSPELTKTLEAFSPEEKNIIGLSIAKGLFDQKLPVAALNQDGSYKIAPEFAATLIDVGAKIQDNKALQKVMSPEQLSALQSAVKFAEKTEDLSAVPAAGYHRLMNGLISMFYFARGWVPGGVRNAIDAASGSGEKTLLYYSAVQDLLSEGLLQKNKQIMVGDLMKVLLPGVGQVTADTAGGQ